MKIRREIDRIGNYYLTSAAGEFSADAMDYWGLRDTVTLHGMTLVKRYHPYRTVTGKKVWDARTLKTDPTVGDLRRLDRAINNEAHWQEHRDRMAASQKGID